MLIDILLGPEDFKMYRCAMGLTTQEVADELLLSKQAISLFETGGKVSKHLMQYYTLGILVLWGKQNYTDDERAWRLECGKAGINVGTKQNKKAVEYIKQHM